MKITKQNLKEIIKEELTTLKEGTIPFHVVLQMAPNLPRGHAVILGKKFENTPAGRAALTKALKSGSYRQMLQESIAVPRTWLRHAAALIRNAAHHVDEERAARLGAMAEELIHMVESIEP